MVGISIVRLTKSIFLFMSIVGIILTIGILCSCNTNKKQSIEKKEIIQPGKTLTLPYQAHKDLLAQHQCLYLQGENTFLYRINPKSTNIHIYLLEDRPVLKDSVIVPAFLQKSNPRFSVISQDSILFYDKYGFFGTYLHNPKTKKTDTLPFPVHPEFEGEKENSFYLNVTASNMPYFKHPYLYLRVSIWTEERKNERGLILRYDITEQKGVYLVDYPNQSPFSENKKCYPYTYNGIENHFKFVVYEDKIIGFYPVYDTLYVYNRYNGCSVQKKKTSSKQVKLPPEKFEHGNEGYFYTTKTPFYKGILYDSFRKVFYIVVKHEMSPEFSTNQGDESFSVLVLNKHLEVIKEWFFEGKKYDSNNILILPDGVYISNTNNYVSKNEKQSFSAFNLLHGVGSYN